MRKLILSAAAAALTFMAVPAEAKDHGNGHGHGHGYGHEFGHHDNGRHLGWYRGRGHDRGEWRRYDWNRPDPRFGAYDPVRYYHPGYYRERRLTRYDRIYRGSDGRYYCRRSDGTTGLIVGGVLGGLLGNALANGHSSTLATLLGAGGGALLGQSIDRGNLRCR
jgi:Ni/Co efflux regulator RcnB